MPSRVLALALAAVLLGGVAEVGITAPASAASATPGAADAGSAISGRVIVTLRDDLAATPAAPKSFTARAAAATAAQRSVMSRAGVADRGVTHFTLVNSFAATVTPEQATALLANPAVEDVIADGRIPLESPTEPSPADTASSLSRRRGPAAPTRATDTDALCPTDPGTPLLEPEALTAIHAVGGRHSAADFASGAGVRVAVFAEAIDPTAPDYIRADGSSAIVDYQNFSGAPEADDPYGEEIFGDASSVAAQGRVVHDLSDFVSSAHPLPDGCNIRIRGVAPDADVVALKVLSPNGSYAVASSLAQAIDYAVTVDHVDVLSESLGAVGVPDSGASDVVQRFNSQAIAAGATVVASSGDAGTTGTLGSPAAAPDVIAAAGSTTLRGEMQVGLTGTTLSNGHWINGNIAAFSSGGTTEAGTVPVLTAPGDVGWAACTDKTDRPGCTALHPDASGNPAPSSIELFGGTSQSAPFIAGVAALVIQRYRDTHDGKSPSSADVRRILTSTADDLGAPSTEQGAGQVNALSAVTLAASYRSTRLHRSTGPGSLLLSTDQFTNTARAGSTSRNTLRVTNTSAAPIALHPTVRRLVPSGDPLETSVTLNPDTDPTLAGASGSAVTYQKVSFQIRRGTDHAALRVAYPSAPRPGSVGDAQVSVSLLDPSGAYAGNTRPQGGSTSSNYANIDLAHPTPGTWTAIVSTTPTSYDFLGIPIPFPAYAGIVHLGVIQSRWSSAGTVSPSAATVRPGATTSLTVLSRVPLSGGDTSLSLSLGASSGAGTANVPITQRVLVGTPERGGTFTGGIVGGNGRSLSPAQTQTYTFEVAPHRTTLAVKLRTADSASTPSLVASLIDPYGQVQASTNNSDTTTSTPAASKTLTATVANPSSGRWRLVVHTVSPVSGLDLVTPFDGAITFDQSPVTSADLAALSPTKSDWAALPADQDTTFSVQVHNTSGVPENFIVDPRTAAKATMDLPSRLSAALPADVFSVLTPNLTVPPDTDKVSATMSSALPLQTVLTGPTAPLLLGGPNAIGAPAHPVAGTATSVATMSSPGGLTPGPYVAAAGSVGPFGPEGAPSGTAAGVATVHTAGFDRNLTTTSGDPYDPASATATPVTVPAGQTATLAITARPSSPVGSEITGHLNIVQLGGSTPIGTLVDPSTAATDTVIAAIPYRYRVVPQQPSIAGAVLSTTGNALSGVTATAYDTQDRAAGYATSRPDGSYSIGGLTPGSYRVCFSTVAATPATETGYQDLCYRNTRWHSGDTTPTDAPKVVVPARGPTVGVNPRIPSAAGISGTVTGGDLSAVAGAAVKIFDSAGRIEGTGATDAFGRFALTRLDPGKATICVDTTVVTGSIQLSECGGQNWAGSDAPPPPSATTTALVGGTFTRADIRLRQGGIITGTITEPTGEAANPFAVDVTAIPVGGGPIRHGISIDSDAGTYEIRGLIGGDYAVCVTSIFPERLAQCWQAADGPDNETLPSESHRAKIHLAEATTTPGIDFRLTASA